MNLLLCSMQGNNRLWAETFKKILVIKFPKSPFQPATSDFCPQKRCQVQCELLNAWMNSIVPGNRYTLHNNEKSIYLKTRTHLVVRGLRIIFVLILPLKYCISLLAEVSHDEAKMRERRETLSFLSFLPRRERPLLAGKYCMWCSCMTENNQQSDKKEVLINNQDKKYNSMKNFKRQQLLFTKTRIESEVSLKILSDTHE